MKILIALTYYTPYVSGVTEFARMLAEHLAREHQVTVLAMHHDPQTPSRETINGVEVVRSPMLLHLHKGVLSPRFFFDFANLARSHDVVNLHLPMLEAGALAYLCDSRRLVSTYQCDMATTGGMIDWLAVQAARLSARMALRRSARIAVTTMDYARTSRIASRGADRLREVRAPIKHPPISFTPRTGSERPGSAPRIGFVGRFVAEKGLPVLLGAFKRLLQDIPGAKLVLVGQSTGVAGGSVIGEIESAIRELGPSIELRGKVDEDELWEIYGSLDVLALPSINRYEAFGMVQVEAMMAGAVVVASNLPGVRTIVQNTGCGVIAEIGNPDSLYHALHQALQLTGALSRAEVSKRVLSHYPAEASLATQEAVLSEVASGRGA